MSIASQYDLEAIKARNKYLEERLDKTQHYLTLLKKDAETLGELGMWATKQRQRRDITREENGKFDTLSVLSDSVRAWLQEIDKLQSCE